MFELNKQSTLLSLINLDGKVQGEDIDKSCFLTLKTTMSNSVFNMFKPGLREFLFSATDDEQKKQGDLTLAEPGSLSSVRFPEIVKIPWNYTGMGYRVVMTYGISEDQDVTFINTIVDSFVFENEDGGSVKIKFRITCKPTPDDVGMLYKMLKREFDLTLEPPNVEERAQLDLEKVASEIDEEVVID